MLIVFALRPPRAAQARYTVLVSALAAGLLLPLTPRWGAGLFGHAAATDDAAAPPRPEARPTAAESAAAVAADPAVEPADVATGDPPPTETTSDPHSSGPTSTGERPAATAPLDRPRIAAVATWLAGVLTIGLRLAPPAAAPTAPAA